MHVEATTESPLATGADTIVVGVFEGEDVAHDLPGGALGALLDSGEARREFKRLAVTHADGARAILVGLGDRSKFDAERARVAAAVAHGRARELGTGTLCWEVPHHVGDGRRRRARRRARCCTPTGSTATSRPSEDSRQVQTLVLSAHHDVSEPVRDGDDLTAAQNRARDLGNTPANDLPPAALADYAEELAGAARDPATVLDEEAIREAGMGAFAAVAQGSRQQARLIRLDYDGTAPARRRRPR